ncbi:MAG: AraC family transcriptional regulator [Bacteroidota bacterium]
MKINIKIEEGLTQLEQMASSFKVAPDKGKFDIPPSLGTGFCTYYELPYNIQLHHYQYCLNQRIEVHSFNPAGRGMYMININLSQRLLQKNVEDRRYALGIEGQAGALFYSPGKDTSGQNEVDVPYEVVFFSIPAMAMQQFIKTFTVQAKNKELPFCNYAELPEEVENKLRQSLAVEYPLDLFSRQGMMLESLGKILSLFYQDEWKNKKSNLKQADVQQLLLVKAVLHTHLFGSAPTIDKLANQVNMSPSQLKSKFKSLFGMPIYRYYLQSKLKVAYKLLKEQEGTIGEIGYRLGYSNLSQFSAQFKKQFGISPSEVKLG